MTDALARGSRAAERHDFHGAITEWEAALVGARSPGPRIDLMLAIADVRARNGERSGARDGFMAAADEAADAGDWHRHARAALGYAGPIEATLDQEPAAALLERSLEHLPADDPLRPRVSARLAVLLWNLEFSERVEQLVVDALAAAEAAGDASLLVYVLRARQLLVGGQPHEAVRSARALVAAAERTADREQIGFAYGWLTGTLFNVGDIDGAASSLLRVDQAAAWGADAFHRDTALMWRATLALLGGRLDEAEELVDAATLDRDSHGTERQMRTLQLLPIRLEQGRLHELTADVERDLTRASAVTWHPFGAFVAATTGDLDGSRRIISSLLARGGSVLPLDSHRGAALAALARAILLTGHGGVEVVTRLLDPFQGHACATTGFCWFGLADRHLGALAAAGGDLDVARAHLVAAITAAVDRRLPFEEGWCRLELGAVLVRSPDTRQDGIREVLAAVDIGRRYDLPRLTHDALEVLGGPTPAAPDAWSTLSAGEIDVARLVAEGFSNREIAGALYRSPLTIETQVKRIFAKLGLKSRAALAAEFVRRSEQMP